MSRNRRTEAETSQATQVEAKDALLAGRALSSSDQVSYSQLSREQRSQSSVMGELEQDQPKGPTPEEQREQAQQELLSRARGKSRLSIDELGDATREDLQNIYDRYSHVLNQEQWNALVSAYQEEVTRVREEQMMRDISDAARSQARRDFYRDGFKIVYFLKT